MISWPSCRLLTCGWPVRDSHRVCPAVCHRCTAGGRLWWAGHVCAASVAPPVPEGVFPVSARGHSGPRGVSHAPHEGSAEGTGDLVHKARVCRLGFRLSAIGGLQLLAHCQRPDLGDREDGAQVGRCGDLRRSLALGDGLQLLPAVQLESPRRRPVPGVRPAAPRPPPEAVEGMAWVPGLAAPDTMAVRGSGGWPLGRGVGVSGRAVFAGSMKPTASRLLWLSCGCGVIRTW